MGDQESFWVKRARRLFRAGLLERIFLKAAIDRAEAINRRVTLFIGSSYAQYGVISKKVTDSVLLAAPSQDMYFGTKLVEKIMETTSVKRCIIIMGYYAPYSDLSLQIKERVIFLGGIYYPLLGDAHNWKKPVDGSHWHKQWRYPYFVRKFVESKLYDYFLKNNSYYEADKSKNTESEWCRRSDEEKIHIAQARTSKHNKLLRYTDTYRNNFQIMKQLKAKLDENNVELYFIIPPFTRWYNELISDTFKITIRTFFSQLNMEGNYIDFNELYTYDDDCFIDADHMSRIGSERFMTDLKNMIIR